MSCLSSILQVCPNLQKFLNDHFSNCNNGMVREEFPFAEFLGSPANNKGLDRVVHPGQGKTRKVDLLYTKRIPESDVAEDQANPKCTATNQYGQCSNTYEIDVTQNVQANEKVNITDLTEVCQNNGEYFLGRIAQLMDVVERKMATDITTQAVALTGAWAADVDGVVANELVVKTLKDGTTQELDPFTMEVIDEALRKTAYCAPAGIFGGSTLSKYARRIMAGCCAQQGIDLMKIWNQYGLSVAYDRRVKTALGSNDKSIVVQLQAIALLWYTVNSWKEGVPAVVTSGLNYVSTVAVTPRLGIPVDVNFKDDCGVIHMIVTGTVKPVAMPDDMFPVGDEFDGVKWFNKIKVTNV